MIRTFGFSGRAAWVLLAAALGLGLGGCGESQPPVRSDTLRVSLADLQQQMGAGGAAPTAQSVGLGGSDATTAAKTLLIGALVIDFQDTPLTSRTPVDDAMRKKLTDAMTNSAAFFQMVQLPVAADSIEINIPPPQASHWEITVFATNTQVLTMDDVSKHPEWVAYFGFEPIFRPSSTAPSSAAIKMQRACLASKSPPNGCAQVGDPRVLVITPAVEILEILDQNGAAIAGLPALPIVVRADGGSDCTGGTPCSAAAAWAALQPAIKVTPATSVLVNTSHQLSPGQSAACLAAKTVADLKAACGVDEFWSVLTPL